MRVGDGPGAQGHLRAEAVLRGDGDGVEGVGEVGDLRLRDEVGGAGGEAAGVEDEDDGLGGGVGGGGGGGVVDVCRDGAAGGGVVLVGKGYGWHVWWFLAGGLREGRSFGFRGNW